MVSAAWLWPSDADEEEMEAAPELEDEEHSEEVDEQEESERTRGDSWITAGCGQDGMLRRKG